MQELQETAARVLAHAGRVLRTEPNETTPVALFRQKQKHLRDTLMPSLARAILVSRYGELHREATRTLGYCQEIVALSDEPGETE